MVVLNTEVAMILIALGGQLVALNRMNIKRELKIEGRIARLEAKMELLCKDLKQFLK